MKLPGTIILSRPDNLGDAVLTLPMAGAIKKRSPGTRIIALVKRYTEPLWRQCTHVDGTIALEDLQAAGMNAPDQLKKLGADAIVHVFPQREVAHWAKQAGIPLRIGTSHRLWHWGTCNKRVHFSRKKSDLHEAQLNFELLAPFGMNVPELQKLSPLMGLHLPEADVPMRHLLRPDKINVILHPLKVTGAAWGLPNFGELMRSMDPARYHVLLTGTKAEAEVYRKALPVELPHITDTGGTLSLEQLMGLIGKVDALVAASTGPLHIAAAAGIRTIGLFNMRRPLHPGRWAPLGPDAHVLVQDPGCPQCKRGQPCDCITRIPVARVLELLPE